MIRTSAVLVLVLAVGCGAEPELVQVGRQAIVNGQPYGGHPSVGELYQTKGYCTATLIGKKTVLTAAHCLTPGSDFAFRAGGVSYKAVSVHPHPSYAANSNSFDIGVMLLAQEPPIASIPIATSAPSVGQKVTLVGFGVTGETANDHGTKRIATTTITKVTSMHVIWMANPGGTCYGDSGGPAFATINGQEVQVGVTESGDPPCGTKDFDTRVDTFASWISQTAGGDVNLGGAPPTPPPPPPADTTPPSVTVSSPASGQTVAASFTVQAAISDDVGVTRAELLVDGKSVAALTAAPWSFSASGLAAGEHRLRVTATDAAGNGGEAIVAVTVAASPEPPPSPGPTPKPDPAPLLGGFGASCKTASDCESGLCAIDRTSKAQYCTATCVVDGCPLGATCYADASGSGLCGLPSSGPRPSSPASPESEVMYGGSCSMASGAAGAQGILLPLVVLILLARRRDDA
jgi:hypothetical protein